MQDDFRKALTARPPARKATRCPLCGEHVLYQGFTNAVCAGPDTCPNVEPGLPQERARAKEALDAVTEAYYRSHGWGVPPWARP